MPSVRCATSEYSGFMLTTIVPGMSAKTLVGSMNKIKTPASRLNVQKKDFNVCCIIVYNYLRGL